MSLDDRQLRTVVYCHRPRSYFLICAYPAIRLSWRLLLLGFEVQT